MASVEEYLAGITDGQRAQYERIRGIVRALVPDVEETISYGMPTLTYRGKYVVYFGAFKRHMSLFPGTVKFTEDDPIPEETIRAMVDRRMAQLT